MKRIALDLDGCVYNYSATAVYLLNHYRGYSLNWEETNSWDWLEKQIKISDWDWLWCSGLRQGLFRYGSLIKGAAEGVKELAKMGKIVVVTSRPANAVQDTLDWLSFMKFPVVELHMLEHGEDKSKVKPDIAIDDNPTQLMNYNKAGIPTIIFDQLYNKDIELPLPDNYTFRATSWNEVVHAARGILGT